MFNLNSRKCHSCSEDNTFLNLTTEKCQKCPTHKFYNSALRQCISCPEGEYLSEENKCEKCKKGEYLNKEKYEC